MSRLYQRTSQSLEGLTDVVITNIQDGQAPVYDATSQVYKNQTVLTPSDLPSGSSGDVIISDGAGGINSTFNLNVNPSNGYITGSYINLNASSVKLGSGAIPGTDTVAIGYQAGFGANTGSVSIGSGSGITAGNSSISVGNGAIAVDNNSIVINATGSPLLSSLPSSCYIDPLRDVTVGSLVSPFIVHYDNATKEMFKAVDIQTRNAFVKGYLTVDSTASLYGGQLTAGVGSNKIIAGAGNNNLVVDLTTQRVGINNANPQHALDVVGHIRLQSGGADRLIFNNTTAGVDIADIDTIVDGVDGGIWGVRTRVIGGALTEKLRINNIGAIGIGGAIYGLPNQVLTSNGPTGAVSWTTPTAPPPSAFGVFYVDGALTIPANSRQQVNNLLPHPSFTPTGMTFMGKQTGNFIQTITLNDAGTYLFSWNINAQQLSGSTINEFELYQNGNRVWNNWYIFSGLENITGSVMINQATASVNYNFSATASNSGSYRLNGFNFIDWTQISIMRLF